MSPQEQERHVIDAGGLKAIEVKKVPLGDLVLYTHGQEQLFALRVELEAGDEFERAGLVSLCIDAGGSGAEPFLFPERGREICLYIGRPTVAWDCNAASLAPLEGGPSPLIVTSDGLALSVRSDPRASARMSFNLKSGKTVRLGHAYRLNTWQIGVIDLDGKFCPLVKYPEQYAKKTR